MLGRLLKTAATALGAVIAVKTADYLAKNIPQMGAMVIVLIAAGAATIFTLLSDEILALGKRRLLWLRKQLDPRSRFEGVWLIHVIALPERPFAYATISYNAEGDVYIYQGCAFSEQGLIGASWVCPKLDFDLAKNEVRFVTEAQVVDVKAQGELTRSCGHIQFEKNFFGRRLRYTRGKGFFADFGTQDRKAHFILDRLDPKTVLSLIQKREVISHEDIVKLVCALAKMKTFSGLMQPLNTSVSIPATVPSVSGATLSTVVPAQTPVSPLTVQSNLTKAPPPESGH